jgi:hypothetical protein
MIEYPKIQSVFKRDKETKKFDESRFSLPSFEYLRNLQWYGTEKIDGMNIRISLNYETGIVDVKGRTDNAMVPADLVSMIYRNVPVSLFEKEWGKDCEVILFGEGYGRKIQKAGHLYSPDEVKFILFDVYIDGWWLKYEDVVNVAEKLKLDVVPKLFEGTLTEAVEIVRSQNVTSSMGDFLAEGLVLKPCVPLMNRDKSMVITKLKHKDFV